MKQLYCENISKAFRGKQIFLHANLHADKGTITGIVGANGVGKSVLFKLISGIYRVDEGNIFVCGKRIGDGFDFPPDMGVFIDSPGFIPLYSGFKNLKLLADIRSLVSSQDIRNAMARVGLDADDKTRVVNYSLGMKQKLGIAQAIMENQDILLLDEPFNALDEMSHAKMIELLKTLKEEGKTIILTSHNFGDILTLCDFVYKIQDAKIVEITSESLYP